MYTISQLNPWKKFCHLMWWPVLWIFCLKYMRALWSMTTMNLWFPVSSSSHLYRASSTPNASNSYLKYAHWVGVNLFDINAAGCEAIQDSPWARTALMPAGQASVMTQTLDLSLWLWSSVVSRGKSHIISFNMGILQVMILISSKHFWWSRVHWKGMWFMQIFCSGHVCPNVW